MTSPLSTHDDTAALAYLASARQHHSQAAIAKHLGVSERQVRRWEVGESQPPQYVGMALQRLLSFQAAANSNADFTFIDLLAGIGGIRLTFEAIGGECVFTSEWDSYAQRTYMANFGGQHPIDGDITQIAAADIPGHDVLLGGFPDSLKIPVSDTHVHR